MKREFKDGRVAAITNLNLFGRIDGNAEEKAMGMESYNILILPENVNIIRDGEYWRLQGASDINIDIILDRLTKLCGRSYQRYEYVFNQCIDVKVYEDNMQFQGFELRGCLSYLKGGSEECHNFYKLLGSELDLNIFIMHKKINIKNSDDLYNAICIMYSEKIEFFRKQYGNIELKVTSGGFYQEMERRSRWYNKIFYFIKNRS